MRMKVFEAKVGISGINGQPETIVERIVARDIFEATAITSEAINDAGHVTVRIQIDEMSEKAFYNRKPFKP